MHEAIIAYIGNWIFLPIAYLSIKENPDIVKQLVLSFIGKFQSTSVSAGLNWAEAETLRFARRILRPFVPQELAAHLRISDRHTRRILHDLVNRKLLIVASGTQRYRTYQINTNR